MRGSLLLATAWMGICCLSARYAQAQDAPDTAVTSNNFTSGKASGGTPAPSTITVRLKAALWNTLSYGTDSAQKTPTGKNSGVLLGSFARLYPSFVAVAANGLEYGANLEVRMNSGGTSGSTGNTLYLRRYNGYVGIPDAGRLYFGPENNALARLSAGTTMEDFDYTGGFNGSNLTQNSTATTINFPFFRVASFYTTNKLVYISPAFAGFTVGGSWEPSQSTGDAEAASGAVLGPQSSSIVGGSGTRRNTVDVAAQYKASLGSFAVTSFVGYLTGGTVNDLSATVATAQYKAISVVAGGIRLIYGPFAFGGTYNTGSMNDNGKGSLLRDGQRNGENVLLGAQYTVGPVIMGFQYVNENSGGYYNSNPAYTRSQLHDTGIVFGGSWDYAPGATLFASALYSQRHQFGYNFVAGTNNTSTGNSAQSRAIQLGNVFRW